MLNKKKNIFENTDFNLFASQIGEAVKSSCENFWEQDIKIAIQAINDYREIRDEKLIANIDFFSSQIKVEGHKPIIVRLSKDFVESILDTTLKTKGGVFQFNNLTPIEIKILNGFCEFLYKRTKDVLIPTNVAKLTEKSEQNINILFTVEPKDELCSKIMVSIPQDRIKLAPLKKIKAFKDEDFFSSNTIVKIKAGSSKITFSELQNLAKDDIIVLENSQLTKLSLISGDVETKFNVKINPSLIVNLNEENEEGEEENIQIYEEVTMEKNLWDDIQIEINAEFEKVKMTIGELKQITQGQIVDLGSIFDNEISLFVEDRKVAKGELIIINDRYAVRLNEILNSNTQKPINAQVNIQAQAKAQVEAKAQTQQAQAKPQTQAKPQAKPQPQNEDEEFDYSDFEK